MAGKLINIRLGEKILSNIDIIKNELEFTNRAQAIAYSARVAKYIVELQASGSKIALEKEDGTIEYLTIIA